MSTSRYQKLNNRKRRLQYRLRERLWAPQDQPMFRARNIHYELSDRLRGLAPGGMGAMHHLARRVGLIAAIDRYLHLLKIHLPYHESDHVLNVAYNILAGGTCLEDLELSRNDEVYLDALGAQRIPDPTTEGDFCRRFTAVDVEILQDTLNEVRLGVVNGTIALTRRPATRAANSTIGASASEEAGKLSCAAGYRHSQCIHDRLEEVHRKRANRPSPAFSPVPVRVRSRALEAAGGILDNAAQCQGQVGGLLAMQDSMDTAGSGDDVNYVYAYDGNGSVAHVLDWSASPAPAAVVAKYEYDPYGNVVAQAGDYAERNPLRFSTKQWDDETGFGYWGYRYYSSRLGRWLTRDPLEEFGGLNLYVYSQSNPASLIDPLGDRTLSYEINVAVPGTGFSAYGRAELGQDGCCFDFDVFLAAEWNPPGIKAIDAVAYRVTGLHVEAGVRGGMKAGVKYCCNQGCLADTKICGRFEGFVRLEHRVRYAKDWGGRKRFTRERFGVGGDLDLELCLSTCSGDVTVNGAVSIWAYAHFGWSWLNRSYDFAQSWSFFDTKLGNCGVAPLRKYCCN